MASNITGELSQFTHLLLAQVAAPAEKSQRDVKGCSESKFLKQRRRCQQIGLTTIVKGERNSRATLKHLRHADAWRPRISQRFQLATEIVDANNVPNVACLRLAKLAADIDERLVRIEDAMEEMNEWKHEHGKQLQELNLRLHDIERLIEEE